ncbi:hypothetical protein INT47_011769 [Mucor saturninus]|uniref:Galactose oxidase n=1 Tax=Mucor saturninus TaxID=64648 RepID=A0A8H7QM64_9FUNG|nr:hypothetical protein INT47_011769 [Mucor saturninus]
MILAFTAILGDVSKDFSVESSYNAWVQVLDPADFATEATFGYTSVKLSDNSVLMNGGTGLNNGKSYMKNQTVIYHADTNQWEAIQNVSSFSQTYYGSGALVQNSSVVFWGGGAAIGSLVQTFDGVAKLSIAQQSYKWSMEANSVAPGYPRYGHTATLDRTGKLIYYFGGRDIVRDPISAAYTRPYSTFSNILVYNTDTAVWQSKTASSTITPSGRMSHTANLIPNTDSIIIYGGAGPDSIGNRIPITDYIYTYNMATNVIQPVSIEASTLGAGARFGHSAVIKNNLLFIFFGIDTTLLATSDFHILDLKSFTWQKNYYATGIVPSTTNLTESGTSTSIPPTKATGGSSSESQAAISETQGLSHGAVAGICVGIFAIIFVGLFWLFLRHRKRQKKLAEEQFPPYWDVTSINKNQEILEAEAPITSTGPVDITRLPGFTTCRTGLPTNITNDNDVNPPPSHPQVLLSSSTIKTPVQSSSVDTYITEHDTKKVLPPDIDNELVTPSIPTEYVKPDTTEKKN